MFQGIAISEGLVLHAGDTLLIRLPEILGAEENEDIMGHFKAELPDIHVVLVAGDIDMMKVTARDD